MPGSSSPALAVSCIRRRSRARRSIAHPLRPHPALSLQNHVNDSAWLGAWRANAFAASLSICRRGAPEIAVFIEGGSGPLDLTEEQTSANRLSHQHCSLGFPRRASTEPLGMNPSGTLVVRRTLFVIRSRLGGGGRPLPSSKSNRGTSLGRPREGTVEAWPRSAFCRLSPPWHKPRRRGSNGDCVPCFRPRHDWFHRLSGGSWLTSNHPARLRCVASGPKSRGRGPSPAGTP